MRTKKLIKLLDEHNLDLSIELQPNKNRYGETEYVCSLTSESGLDASARGRTKEEALAGLILQLVSQ